MMRHVKASEAERDAADARSLKTLEASADKVRDADRHAATVQQNASDHQDRLQALEVGVMGEGFSGLVAGDRIGQPHRVHIDTLSPQVLAFLKRARVL
jgi:hypothetical protein